MKVKNGMKLAIFILMFALILPIPSVYAGDKKSIAIYPRIEDAYYADIDNDTNEDDVRITVSLKIEGIKDKTLKKGVAYNVIIGLVLPDGTEFWYILSSVAYNKKLKLDFDLLNHATVSGWYEAHSIAYFDAYQTEYIYYHGIIFDPPGGQDHGNPTVNVQITSY